jgi:hypothetical protein
VVAPWGSRGTVAALPAVARRGAPQGKKNRDRPRKRLEVVVVNY